MGAKHVIAGVIIGVCAITGGIYTVASLTRVGQGEVGVVYTMKEGVQQGIYGRDVRQAIHDGIKQCYADAVSGTIDATAREGLDKLKEEITPITDQEITDLLYVN